jgi:hypothetical protein
MCTHCNESQPIRVLSLDGGGIRGLAILQVLQFIETMPSAGNQSILTLFDVFAGTSVGSVITALLVHKQRSVNEVIEMFVQGAYSNMFSKPVYKRALSMLQLTPTYDATPKTELLLEWVGEDCSFHLPAESAKRVVLPVFNVSERSTELLRSASSDTTALRLYRVLDAATACPGLFPSRPLEESGSGAHTYIDAAIRTNSPILAAVAEAHQLREDLCGPECTRAICALSIGTGYSTACDEFSDSPLHWVLSGRFLDYLHDNTYETLACKLLLKPSGEYLRIDGPLELASTAPDDTSVTNLRRLKEAGEAWCYESYEKLAAFLSTISDAKSTLRAEDKKEYEESS